MNSDTPCKASLIKRINEAQVQSSNRLIEHSSSRIKDVKLKLKSSLKTQELLEETRF